MDFENLKIVGTSHIAKQSIEEIRRSISEIKPGYVCVELDKNRMYALMNDEKRKINASSMFKIGLKGFLFALLGNWISKKLGKAVGVIPGVDMKTAIIEAGKNNAKVALIDRDIQITLRRLSKYMGWKDRWNFFVDIFKGIFFKKRMMKEYGLKGFDLNKVPADELIKKMISRMKIRYPGLYRVLIYERNVYMTARLIKLMKSFPSEKIVAVMGAGHKDDILKMVREKFYKTEVVPSGGAAP